MSLTIQDLGLAESLRDIVGEFNSALVYLIEAGSSDSSNPYEHTPGAPIIRLNAAPAMSVKQLSAEQTRSELGAVDTNYYQCTIATPELPVVIETGLYGVINFSNNTEVVTGVLERVEYKLSSLIQLTINTSENTPFTLSEIGL